MQLIGKWDGWAPFFVNDPSLLYNYSIMEYGGGDECGTTEKSAILILKCEHNEFNLISVDDTSNGCYYTFILGIPIHCSLLIGSSPSVYLQSQATNEMEMRKEDRPSQSIEVPDFSNTDKNSKQFFSHRIEDTASVNSKLERKDSPIGSDSSRLDREDLSTIQNLMESIEYIKQRVDLLIQQQSIMFVHPAAAVSPSPPSGDS